MVKVVRLLQADYKNLLSKLDVVGCNIKGPAAGIIKAGGAVRHHKIVLRIGVPRPQGITAFHQVINDKRLPLSESIAAITADGPWSALL